MINSFVTVILLFGPHRQVRAEVLQSDRVLGPEQLLQSLTRGVSLATSLYCHVPQVPHLKNGEIHSKPLLVERGPEDIISPVMVSTWCILPEMESR